MHVACSGWLASVGATLAIKCGPTRVVPAGQSYPTSLLSHIAFSRSPHATPSTLLEGVAWAADGHKLSEDWLMGLQGCMRMMEFTCSGRSPSDPGELELAHPGKHDEKSSSQAGRLVP